MKRKEIHEILNECVFDKSIPHDYATVSVAQAEEAMRRYAQLREKELYSFDEIDEVLQQLNDKHDSLTGHRENDITQANADGFQTGLAWAIDRIEKLKK